MISSTKYKFPPPRKEVRKKKEKPFNRAFPSSSFLPSILFLHSRFLIIKIFPGGHLHFRLDIILVKSLSKHTLNTYFSGTKIDPKYAFFLISPSCPFQKIATTGVWGGVRREGVHPVGLGIFSFNYHYIINFFSIILFKKLSSQLFVHIFFYKGRGRLVG